MSEQSDKPFVCGIPGCGQRFANHDHLTTHQQKHEFSLKFKAGESLLVDQTPTPTRFLRNLEESGLFQELEANPFDQDFKQATNGSSGKGGVSKADSRQPGSAKPPSSAETKVASDVPPSSASGTVTRGTATIPVAPPPTLANPEKAVPMASAPPHISNTAASAITKQRLLQNIQLKEQQKMLEQQLAAHLVGQNPELLAQALKAVSDASPSKSTTIEQQGTEVTFVSPSSDTDLGANGSVVKRKRGRKPDDEDPEVKRMKFLERNRAAASRCRAKKKHWVESLEKKAKDIELVNQALQQEVLMLRSEVQQLKSILIAHKDCPLIVHNAAKSGESSGSESVDVPSSQAISVTAAGVTLLSQLANMPSMSPLIASPVPSVGSVVPNIGTSSNTPPTTIIITTNGISQQTLEVGKDVEISADSETQTAEQ